jgi:5-formyltetrahydrofolate cyclo-ligase
MDKKEIRRNILRQRRDLGLAEKQALDKNIREKLIEFLEGLGRDLKLGIFYPKSDEINLLDVSKHNFKNKISLFLPRINEQKSLDFYPLNKNRLEKNSKFQVLEPIADGNNYELDIIICPLIAFDKNFNRIGYGGGFYDRFLENAENLIKIGVAYKFQKLAKLPVEMHDARLDLIIY